MKYIIYFLRKINCQIFSSLFRIFCVFCTVISIFSMVACNVKPIKQQENRKEMPNKPIEVVLKKHTDTLMSFSGVVGTGQGLHEGTHCIKVFVTELTPELKKKIPKQLEGYPVVIEETGAFKSLPKDKR